jgi:putative serine protease PepD
MTAQSIAALAAAALTGAATALALAGEPAVAAAPSSTAGSAQVLQQQFVQVVERVAPSVVLIETARGLGSGVVFDAQGDIVTNDHVVAGGNTFSVTVRNGTRYPARLVGRFAPADLAVLHIDATGLQPAAFADSTDVAVGELALAIGNPLGLQSSVTQGIVSALGRAVKEDNGIVLRDVIQTSAAINHGNSGGALVDLDGRVIGIPTLTALDHQLTGGRAPGIGFAVPSNVVRVIATRLAGTRTH